MYVTRADGLSLEGPTASRDERVVSNHTTLDRRSVGVNRLSTLWKIAGDTVYDPLHGIDGQVLDLWIDESTGRMVSAPLEPSEPPRRVLNATGLVVMPGGVDMHCHIACPKGKVAHKMSH